MVSVSQCRPKFVFIVAWLFLLTGKGYTQASGQTLTSSAQISDRLIHSLCGKRVALLGENPVHGFGQTLAFKVELVRRLVDECHYNAFFIEGGTYDFIHIQNELNAGRQITDPMVSAAIGGLWANEEVQSLVPFLRDQANRHLLALGGMDDQINRGSYAQLAMPHDLVQFLPADQQAHCLSSLQEHMPWHYNPDISDTPQDKANIVACLELMQASLPAQTKRTRSEEGTANMLDSLQRNFARELAHDLTKRDQRAPWMNERDRSMYLNFRWWLSKLPSHSKIIVWAATVHTANDLSSVPGFEPRIPLGSYIKKDFGDKAFSLGFSAYSGSYWLVRPPAHELPIASAKSLEGMSFAHAQGDAVYLSRKELHAVGPIPARPLDISFATASWEKVLDGLVIFRKERVPTMLKP